MPADGMHAAAYAKTEFRRPFLGSSKQIYHAFLTLESRATRRFHHAANVSCWPITTCCTGGVADGRFGGYCCKNPFASLIRKFLGRRRVFRVRMWGVT